MTMTLKNRVVVFMIIVALTILYIAFMWFYVAPLINSIVFQTAYGQQFNNPGDQFSDPSFGYDQNQNQQYGQQGYNQGYDQQQYGNQYQQPYGMNQQYGTPYMQQPYGMQQPYQQGYGGFGIQEIITALVAGGGATVYARRRANSLEDDKQVMMSEILKGKQVDAELARITYNMNADKSNQINDAPSIKLENLQQDVNQFTDKTSKA